MLKKLLILLLIACIPLHATAEAPFLEDGLPAQRTADSYRSQSIALTITRSRVDDTDVYVVDLHLRSVEQLRRAYGSDRWGKGNRRVADIARDCGALLAITGDSAQNFDKGWVIGNGVTERDSSNSKRDLCIIYRSGEMKTLSPEEIDPAEMASGEVWQTFLFGPALLDDAGRAITDFSSSNVRYDNPRAVIGYYAPGHYCLVQVDGRGTASALESGRTNAGMTLTELALFMESLGCAAAYNLDGGRSAMLWYDGAIISTAADASRCVGDLIYISAEE